MATLLSTVSLVLVLFLLMNLNVVRGANILAIFNFPSESHRIIKSALFTELAARGHNVTIVSPIPDQHPVENVEEIYISRVVDVFKKYGDTFLYRKKQKYSLTNILFFWDIVQDLCENVLTESYIQELIHSNDKKFDLVFLEGYFSDCLIPFGHKFNAPIIKLSTFGGTNWMVDWVGNPNEYSYVPDSYLPFTDKMTFLQRMINTGIGTLFKLTRRMYHLPRLETTIRKFFNDSLPPLLALEYSTSLLFLNTHFSIGYPRPLLPNVVQIGGLHLKPPEKLPQDIQEYLDEAEHGVIYFSMGSVLKGTTFPNNLRKSFLEAFSKLKQKVLWKWETESMEGLPNNVKLFKWVPQSDILAHPNVKAFLTHGGLLSIQEAIDRGVPIVGIPVFGDQTLNSIRAQTAGYGIMLNFFNISTESVTWALREIMDNPKYKESARKLSRIFRDQPLPPLEQAVFWTEYVIRHKGAPHMRSAALDLTWYQYFLLDVIAVLTIAVLLILFILFVFIRYIFRKFCKIVISDSCIQVKKKKIQ